MNIQGVCPVLSVPFHKTGEVDYQSFKSLVSWITSLGTQSVLFFGVASENIKLLDDDGEEIRFDMNNLEENNELVRKFQKLAGIQTENETKPVTAPPTTKPGVTPKRRTLTPPKPAPKTNPKAPSKIDFPAPVSPVIIENPSEKSIPNLSIKAKLLIESEASIKSIYI